MILNYKKNVCRIDFEGDNKRRRWSIKYDNRGRNSRKLYKRSKLSMWISKNRKTQEKYVGGAKRMAKESVKISKPFKEWKILELRWKKTTNPTRSCFIEFSKV